MGFTKRKTAEVAAEYHIETLTSNIDHDPEWLSYLKITLPWQLLEELDGEQRFKDWVRYLCETLDVDQGYAGLACNLPMTTINSSHTSSRWHSDIAA